jgi:hypothetical protein
MGQAGAREGCVITNIVSMDEARRKRELTKREAVWDEMEERYLAEMDWYRCELAKSEDALPEMEMRDASCPTD